MITARLIILKIIFGFIFLGLAPFSGRATLPGIELKEIESFYKSSNLLSSSAQQDILEQSSCFTKVFYRLHKNPSEEEQNKQLIKQYYRQKNKTAAKYFFYLLTVGGIGSAIIYVVAESIPNAGGFGGAFAIYPCIPLALRVGDFIGVKLFANSDKSLEECERKVVSRFRDWNEPLQESARTFLIKAISSKKNDLYVEKLKYLLSLPFQLDPVGPLTYMRPEKGLHTFLEEYFAGEELLNATVLLSRLFKEGSPTCIRITGEPGTGKSTFCDDVIRFLGAEGITIDLSQGSFFGDNASPGTLLEAFRSRITENKPVIVKLENLDTSLRHAKKEIETALLTFCGKEEAHLPYLGVKTSRFRYGVLAPVNQWDKQYNALSERFGEIQYPFNVQRWEKVQNEKYKDNPELVKRISNLSPMPKDWRGGETMIDKLKVEIIINSEEPPFQITRKIEEYQSFSVTHHEKKPADKLRQTLLN